MEFEFEFDVDAKRPRSSPKRVQVSRLSTVHYPVPIPECTEPTTRPTSPTEARSVHRYAGMYVRREAAAKDGTGRDWVGRERQMMMRWEVVRMDAARCEMRDARTTGREVDEGMRTAVDCGGDRDAARTHLPTFVRVALDAPPERVHLVLHELLDLLVVYARLCAVQSPCQR